jgi:hypothetical protein
MTDVDCGVTINDRDVACALMLARSILLVNPSAAATAIQLLSCNVSGFSQRIRDK